MKVRLGFVSNSSSSSFLIYGTCVDVNKVLEQFPELNRNEDGDVSNDDLYNLPDIIEAKFPSLYVSFGPDNESSNYLYIGRSWSSVKDNETGAEFKAQVEEMLSLLFNGDMRRINVGTYREAWYNG